MRYKLNVRKKLDELDGLIMRLQYQIGRQPLETQEETLVKLKEKVVEVQELIEYEDDNYKPQF